MRAAPASLPGMIRCRRWNVYPKNGLYWQKPQVAYLKWKCTGTPVAINELDYQTPYCVKIGGEWHVQCNCIVLITLQSAEN